MKRKQLLLAAILLAASGVYDASAQTKKQLIEELKARSDSMEKALSVKTAEFHALEVKSAKLEGAAEVYQQTAKKAENRADSLSTLLKTKEGLIADLNKQLADLNTEADKLRTEGKTLADQNQALTTELASFKKKESAPVTAETKATTSPVKKEENAVAETGKAAN